jgi:hypothetical protein
VQDGVDHELDAAVVDAGQGVAEVHGYAAGQAGGQPEHPVLAAFSELPAVLVTC